MMAQRAEDRVRELEAVLYFVDMDLAQTLAVIRATSKETAISNIEQTRIRVQKALAGKQRRPQAEAHDGNRQTNDSIDKRHHEAIIVPVSTRQAAHRARAEDRYTRRAVTEQRKE